MTLPDPLGSTGVFDAYSRYYDLLYRDKDYATEARYIADRIREHHPTARTLLDLGCGTGRHAAELAGLGLEVTGVERSVTMLDGARSLHAALPQALRTRLDFVAGDARSVRLGRQVDVVTALFHVASYQTDNASLRALLDTAAAHLPGGGLLMFDYWYGPAVLNERPEPRSKVMRDAEVEIRREATPTLHVERNLVDVDYRIVVRELATDRSTELQECHPMRYLFSPELDWYLDACGFDVLTRCEFGTGRPLGLDTWNALCLARRRAHPG